MIAMLRIVSRWRITPSYHVGQDAPVSPVRSGGGATKPARGRVGARRQRAVPLPVPVPALFHPVSQLPAAPLHASQPGPPGVRPAGRAGAGDDRERGGARRGGDGGSLL